MLHQCLTCTQDKCTIVDKCDRPSFKFVGKANDTIEPLIENLMTFTRQSIKEWDEMEKQNQLKQRERMLDGKTVFSKDEEATSEMSRHIIDLRQLNSYINIQYNTQFVDNHQSKQVEIVGVHYLIDAIYTEMMEKGFAGTCIEEARGVDGWENDKKRKMLIFVISGIEEGREVVEGLKKVVMQPIMGRSEYAKAMFQANKDYFQYLTKKALGFAKNGYYVAKTLQNKGKFELNKQYCDYLKRQLEETDPIELEKIRTLHANWDKNCSERKTLRRQNSFNR